jgi:hypothetical protein
MASVLFALAAWSTMVTVVVAQQEKLPKDHYALVNAKTMSSSIETETVTLVVPMKLFPEVNAPAKQDTPEMNVESALSHAQLVNSSSKEPVLAALLTPSITPPLTDAHAPTDSTWTHTVFAKDSPSGQSPATMDNTSTPIMDALLAVLNARPAEDQINASPAPETAFQLTHKDFAFLPAAMESSSLLRPAILEEAHQMDALAAESFLGMLAMDNHQFAD